MSSVIAAATEVGAHVYDQTTVKEYVERWLNGSRRGLERMVESFDHTLVRTRASVEPIDYVFSKRGFRESNELYKRHAVRLARECTERCLEAAGIRADEVDYFISTSCTGIMIPSFEAIVAEQLGMKRSLRRLPITEHGCAAGAVALSHAHQYLLAYPEHRVLVVAVEIPSLTFQTGDKSATNVISSALFGDGAAAVLLSAASKTAGPTIVQSASHRFQNSADWMGFDLRDSGLHIVLSPRVPGEIRSQGPALIREFLGANEMQLKDVRHFLLHPGGRKIIEAFEETLGLHAEDLAISRQVLTKYGNLSSATVLFILKEHLQRSAARPGDRGLLMAFGPGFSAEMLLLEW